MRINSLIAALMLTPHFRHFYHSIFDSSVFLIYAVLRSLSTHRFPITGIYSTTVVVDHCSVIYISHQRRTTITTLCLAMSGLFQDSLTSDSNRAAADILIYSMSADWQPNYGYFYAC